MLFYLNNVYSPLEFCRAQLDSPLEFLSYLQSRQQTHHLLRTTWKAQTLPARSYSIFFACHLIQTLKEMHRNEIC